MRKILLLFVLSMGYCLPAFSQVYQPFAVDSTLNLPMNITIPMNIVRNRPTSPIRDNSYLYQYQPQNNKTDFGNSIVDSKIHRSDFNMPVIKPTGNFTMPICKPDSSVTYTMLIKRF